jgi:hypothetical protein
VALINAWGVQAAASCSTIILYPQSLHLVNSA